MQISITSSTCPWIADANLPLKRFALCHCTLFTSAGVSYFLRSYHSLDSISLGAVNFLNDSELKFLYNFKWMNNISLNCFRMITGESFYTLLETCPLLEKLQMANTWFGYQECSEDKMHKIASLCPKLNYLNVSNCFYASDCIISILESWKMIRHLKFNRCQNIVGVEDTSMFARTSPLLRCLDLRFCKEITSAGIKLLLLNCPNLAEIDMMGSMAKLGFAEKVLAYGCPLRKIVFPDDEIVSPYDLVNPFLRSNCNFCSIDHMHGLMNHS